MSRALLLAVALALPCGASAARREVVLLKSDALEPYARFAGGLGAGLGEKFVEHDCRGDAARCAQLARMIAERPPDVVVALGPLAATAAAKAELNVLFALVPAHERYPLGGRTVAGISLTRPYRAQLEALRAVVPGLKKVAVVYDPRRSKAVVDLVADAASDLSLELVRGKVEGKGVGAVVRAVAGDADALLLVPDPVIGSEAAFGEVLATSRTERLPTFALSEAMVKEGMLVALSPDYAALGLQAAKLGRRIADGAAPSSIGVVAPEGVEVAVNLSTARRLGLGDDAIASLLRHAAKLGCTVKAFE